MIRLQYPLLYFTTFLLFLAYKVNCSSSPWTKISEAAVEQIFGEDFSQSILGLPEYHKVESRLPSDPVFQRDEDCSQTIGNLTTGSTGTISSPNYPGNYPPRSQCEWIIEGEPGTVIQGTFFDMVTQPWAVFFLDYVLVSDTGDFDVYHRFTGDVNRIMPYTIVSKANKLSIRFVSSYLLNYRGFKMSYIVRAVDETRNDTMFINEEGSVEDNILAAVCDETPIPNLDKSTQPEEKLVNSKLNTGLWSSNKQDYQRDQRGNSVHRIAASSSEVTPNQFPFMAALLFDDRNFCSGSLIDANHILTVAHCTQGAEKVEIFLGTHNLTSQEPSRQYQVVNSSYVVAHPQYNSQTGAHDIAVIRLAEKVSFNAFVQPVYLPTPQSMSNSFTTYNLTTIGWGEVNKTTESYRVSPVLRKVAASVIPNGKCKRTFRDAVTGNVMCASGSRSDSPCHGDSGSPLITEFKSSPDGFSAASAAAITNGHHQCVFSDLDKKKESNGIRNWFVQLGVLTFRSRSCGSFSPVVFTRLTAYIDFINDVTRRQQF